MFQKITIWLERIRFSQSIDDQSDAVELLLMCDSKNFQYWRVIFLSRFFGLDEWMIVAGSRRKTRTTILKVFVDLKLRSMRNAWITSVKHPHANCTQSHSLGHMWCTVWSTQFSKRKSDSARGRKGRANYNFISRQQSKAMKIERLQSP